MDCKVKLEAGAATETAVASAVMEETNNSDAAPDESDSDVDDSIRQKHYQRTCDKEQIVRNKSSLIGRELSIDDRKRRLSPAAVSVKMDHVFGYRGYDCLNNVCFTLKGGIAYHVAAIGIVLDRTTPKQRFYIGHTDDILCLAAHPLSDLLATGQVGKCPTVHVWSAEDMQMVSMLKNGHDTGVCAVDFSANGKFLISVGLDQHHTVEMWNWRKGTKLATARGHSDRIFAVKFNPSESADKFVTAGTKHLKFWKYSGSIYFTLGNGFTSERGIFGSVSKIETMLCICFSTVSSNVCYTSTASGNVCIWQENKLLKTVRVTSQLSAEPGAPCLCIVPLEKGFVTSGKDGAISLWNEDFTKCLKTYPIANEFLCKDSALLIQDLPPVRAVTLGYSKIVAGTKHGDIVEVDPAGSITVLTQGHREGELWGLAPHPSELKCATASDDGFLRLWDLSSSPTQRCFQYKKLNGPARSVAYSPDASLLAVGFKDGRFAVVDAKSMDFVFEVRQRKEEIAVVRFSLDGKYVAVGSHDNFIDIFDVAARKRIGVCKGSSSYINHLDWDTKGSLLQVNSGSRERLFFEIPRCRLLTTLSAETADELTWASWSCVLGDTCEGIWPPESNITDVNAADLNQKYSILATGDDFGFLKLFQYPTKGKYAKYRRYLGHSAHVTNVAWTTDNEWLLSTGGSDTALCVWRLLREEVGDSDGDSSSLTDSDEDVGYDSDVAQEKSIDYTKKMYSASFSERFGGGTVVAEAKKQGQSRKAPDDEAESETTDSLVSVRLKLETVFGYRGFDCSNNLFYLNNRSEIVFHAAAVGIVHNINTGEQKFYLQHTDDILALAVNRNEKFQNLVATAQIDAITPCIRVWDAVDLQTVSILKPTHEKGINNLDFSASGRYLLSVGIDDRHTISVWNFQKGALRVSAECGNRKVCCAQFRPDSDTKLVTVGIKHVKFWKITGGVLSAQRGRIPSATSDAVQLASPPVTGDVSSPVADAVLYTMLSIAFETDDVTYTGCVTGDIYMWKYALLQRIVRNAHKGPIFVMRTTLADGFIVSGAKEKRTEHSECIKLWNPGLSRFKSFNLNNSSTALKSDMDVVKSVCRFQDKILVGTKQCGISEIDSQTGTVRTILHSHSAGELWALSCHPNTSIAATAGHDPQLILWDLERKLLIAKQDLEYQACALHFSQQDGSLLALGYNNGAISIHDSATLSLLQRQRDHCNMVTSIRFSPNDQFLAVAIADGTVDVYGIRAKQIGKRLAYSKSAAPDTPTHLDFSVDSALLKVSTNSQRILVLRAADCSQVTHDAELAGATWASWTCVCDPKMGGALPKYSGKSSKIIICSAVSKSGKSLAVGDDFGIVKLLDFPCESKQAPYWAYAGHSAHVTNVCFTFDDKFLISTGGDDSCNEEIHRVQKNVDLVSKHHDEIRGLHEHLFLTFKNT